MGHKKEQLVKLDESQLKLFAVDEPEAKLRVVRVTANDQAKLRRLRFDRNMEIPGESIISRLFRGAGQDGGSGEAAGVESLAIWQHSNGTSLGTTKVIVEARRLKDRVYALVGLE